MCRGGTDRTEDPLASTVFGASLTLVAILMGVVAIFESEVQSLTSRGLTEAAKSPAGLRDMVVLFLLVSCWCAFWSYLHVVGWISNVLIYAIPIGLIIVALFAFVPVWIWFPHNFGWR